EARMSLGGLEPKIFWWSLLDMVVVSLKKMMDKDQLSTNSTCLYGERGLACEKRELE
ncbi:unnamed protein product, partial [Dovyalis caffra]